MRRIIVTISILLVSLIVDARARDPAETRDLAGSWQGTLAEGAKKRRVVVEVAKGERGDWLATLHIIDQTYRRIPVDSISVNGSTLRFSVDSLQGSYDGKISGDGVSIYGTWTQEGAAMPLALERATKETQWALAPRTADAQFVIVEEGVKLEVLDWGGSGRPLVLLTGLGDNAHVYDQFALKLTSSYHVYGITRRGFGASSVPTTGYAADRLGEDVLVVLDALKLTRPILAGHSIAGQELSYLGSRYPERISGLIYLDAGGGFAYYDESRGHLDFDLIELQQKLEQLRSIPPDPAPLIDELLTTFIPRVERRLQERSKMFQLLPPTLAGR